MPSCVAVRIAGACQRCRGLQGTPLAGLARPVPPLRSAAVRAAPDNKSAVRPTCYASWPYWPHLIAGPHTLRLLPVGGRPAGQRWRRAGGRWRRGQRRVLPLQPAGCVRCTSCGGVCVGHAAWTQLQGSLVKSPSASQLSNLLAMTARQVVQQACCCWWTNAPPICLPNAVSIVLGHFARDCPSRAAGAGGAPRGGYGGGSFSGGGGSFGGGGNGGGAAGGAPCYLCQQPGGSAYSCFVYAARHSVHCVHVRAYAMQCICVQWVRGFAVRMAATRLPHAPGCCV